MSSTREYPQLLEIDFDGPVYDIAFTANGEHLVVGSWMGIQVWRIKDGQLMASHMRAESGFKCIAASRDGKYIAAGSWNGYVFAWDVTTFEEVFVERRGPASIDDVDFSPDSTRLLITYGTVTVWDIAAGEQVQALPCTAFVAKYSPQGKRIATASWESVQVWDSNVNDGCSLALIDINVQVSRRGLLWHDNHLFVKTKNRNVKRVDASTGSTVSGWPVPHVDSSSCIALPRHARFIAYATNKTITFLDTSADTRPSPIQHTDDIHSITCSSDGQLLAIVAGNKITVKDTRFVVAPFPVSAETSIKEPLPVVSHLILEPELGIDAAPLNAWKHDQLTDADALLSAAIPTLETGDHCTLASRALVRARLGHLDAALVDANKSINTRRSLLAYVAKSLTLISKGEKEEGIRVCDIAFEHFHLEHVSLLLLIKAVVLFIAGDHVDAISRMDVLITDNAHPSLDPVLYQVQAYMHLLLGNKRMESSDYERAIQSFSDARTKMDNHTRRPPLIISLISGWKFDVLGITIKQNLCEALLAAGRVKEACEGVVHMLDEEIDATEPIETWASDFKCRCCGKLGELGDSAMNAHQYAEAISLYTAALSLKPATPQDLLVKRSNAWGANGARGDALSDAKEWVGLMLTSGSWEGALDAAAGFILDKSIIYRAVCEHLEMTGRVADAVACFHRTVAGKPARKTDKEQTNWVNDFKSRCHEKLKDAGNVAAKARQYDRAVSHYTTALSLEYANRQDLLVRRSKAYAEQREWKDALKDANEAIKLDPSSPLGYERMYAALLGMGCYDKALGAREAMLSKMPQSSDPAIRGQSRCCVEPEKAKEAIRVSIQSVIRNLPLVLVNTLSGRLYNKSQQAAAFESTPAFTTLIASMTTQIDHALIKQVVGGFYRYATLSHTWEGEEPLYESVINTVVYDLATFPTHDKLQMFCKIARDEGFNWAWSDTCCINKGDQFILQEALVSMFKWYEGSAMTIIFLCDVDRLAEIGALMMSLWNSRGWTLQEYHASKVVRIYTKDWTPYLGLTIRNHKESPEIISEMEKATGISAESLTALRPGLNNIREKLRLASTRRTTRVEDAAYSLLGIFSMTLPATYGEGDKALGRLLSQLLTSSGDTSILAWTGRSGSFNSCLPTEIIVFSQPSTSHIPPAIPDAEMATLTSGLHTSLLALDLVTMLYNQLKALPLPSFLIQRMKLPCIAFKIRTVSRLRSGSEIVFRAQASGLGIVEIKARQDLTQLDSLYLVHPWIDYLLDRRATRIAAGTEPNEGPFELDESLSSDAFPDFPTTLDDTESLASPTVAPMEAQMEFLARLRQSFGALLLAPTRRNVPEYRRIATENVITAQVREMTSATLNKLIYGVRVLDVL